MTKLPQRPLADRQVGYYMFLGQGDYWEPVQPVAAWTLREWVAFIDWMAARGFNSLWLLVNGFYLSYPSRRYPGLLDPQARNARRCFLRALTDEAHARGIRVHLMLTTDDHARAFGLAHPETVRVDAGGRPGAAQALALEHPRTRRYIEDVLEETLELCPNADGVAFHPTEVDPERFNPETIEAWRREHGTDFRRTSRAERDVWYNQVFARYIGELAARARALRPGIELSLANCWWMDPHAQVHARMLPREVRVAVWYYNWQDRFPEPWPIYRWADLLGADRLLYMPTSAGYLFPPDEGQRQLRHRGNDRLISTADALGVHDLVYFAGFGEGSTTAREIDAELARRPSSALARGREAKWRVVNGLYRDYSATRRRLGLPESLSAASSARKASRARRRPFPGSILP